MTKFIRVGCLVCIGLLSNNIINAQDNPQLDLSKDLESWYDQLIDQESKLLFQGKLADLEPKASNSHPYLGRNQWQTGDVTWRNQQFKSLPLIYNIERDELIIQRGGLNPYEMFIELKKDMVSSFKILNSSFIQITNNPLDNPGFYEVLFEGNKLKFYARRVKALDINGDDGFQYIQSNKYYILFENKYYNIRSAGNLARIFKSNKKLINEFAYRAKIRKLNSQTDLQFIALIQYCNSLDL